MNYCKNKKRDRTCQFSFICSRSDPWIRDILYIYV